MDKKIEKRIKELAVLVIDDDAMVREVIVEYLLSFGFKNVMPVRSGEKALKLLKDEKIKLDLILSDWEMPGINGLTLLKAVRNNPKRSVTPFIMITSQQSMERFKITQAAQWHVDSYLVKPFRSEVLKQRIWSVLGWLNNAKKSA